jgi:hypothetical protein
MPGPGKPFPPEGKRLDRTIRIFNAGLSPPGIAMPMECLAHVAKQQFPHHVFDAADIEKLRVLRAAGLVSVYIPSPDQPLRSGMIHTPATVLAVTTKGLLALQESPQAIGL